MGYGLTNNPGPFYASKNSEPGALSRKGNFEFFSHRSVFRLRDNKYEHFWRLLDAGTVGNTRLGRMGFDVIQNILDGSEFFCFFIGDFDVEFFFHSHD